METRLKHTQQFHGNKKHLLHLTLNLMLTGEQEGTAII